MTQDVLNVQGMGTECTGYGHHNRSTNIPCRLAAVAAVAAAISSADIPASPDIVKVLHVGD